MSRFLLIFTVAFFAFGLVPPSNAETGDYVGVKKCSTCHKKDKQGEQFKIWQKSEHSKAFKALGSAKAKTRAAKLGVKGNPQEAEACLVCHTTSVGVDKARMGDKFNIEDGVQCETCHGAGSLYRKKKVMKKIFEERGMDRKGKSATAKKTGLVFPDKNTCTSCHAKQVTVNGKTYKNPSYKPFDFKKMSKKIDHSVPSRK